LLHNISNPINIAEKQDNKSKGRPVLAIKVVSCLQGALWLKELNIFGLRNKKIFILFSVICFKIDIYKFNNFQVPERVRAMNASIKLLLIVREPVTRAISDYTQLRSHAATAILPLAEKDPPSPARESSGGGAGGTAAFFFQCTYCSCWLKTG